MKRNSYYTKFLQLLAILILLASCAPVYYAPNAHNVPLLTEKHEATVSASYAILDDIGPLVGTDLQLAIAVTDNVGIMANGMFTKALYDDNEILDAACKGQFFEMGGGYFRSLDENPKSDIIFETYGGFGFGKYINTSDNTIWPSSASFQRFFVQPSMGIKSKYFEAAISFRLAGLNYSKYEIRSGEPYLPMDQFTWLFEPALTLRAGFKSVKVQWQVGISENLNNPNLLQSRVYVGFSLLIRIQGQNSTL